MWLIPLGLCTHTYLKEEILSKAERDLVCVFLSHIYRVSPSVPFTSRTLDKDTILGDYTLPKGVSALLFMFLTHCPL